MKSNVTGSDSIYSCDGQFALILHRSVESYLKFKKSYEVAKKILSDNCHDFYITIDSAEEDYKYSHIINAANERNVNIDLSIYDLDCSLDDVASILDYMCKLELSWLDEHRSIFDTCDDMISAYYDEEEKTLSFYRSLISGLSKEQITLVEESLDDAYLLSLY